MRYGSGWANGPNVVSIQAGQVGPSPRTQTLKMTDALIRHCQVDLRLRRGIRVLSGKFWHKRPTDEDPGSSSSSMSSTQWRPRLRAEKDLSSVAGDTSVGSTDEGIACDGVPGTRSAGQ